MMKQRNLRRRVLKRRLSRQQERIAEAAINNAQYAAIEAILSSKRMQNALLDDLQQERKKRRRGRQRALGDGSFLDFLKNIDWDKLIELIMKIIGLFA